MSQCWSCIGIAHVHPCSPVWSMFHCGPGVILAQGTASVHLWNSSRPRWLGDALHRIPPCMAKNSAMKLRNKLLPRQFLNAKGRRCGWSNSFQEMMVNSFNFRTWKLSDVLQVFSGWYNSIIFCSFLFIHSWNFTLWLFNSSPWKPWPIELDGLPVYLLNMVIFHGYVK
jgi:hypothetical protein